MNVRQCLMHSDDAPPNFWRANEAVALVDGVELESAVPTRFFQSLDAYPPEWGRLIWRVQLNRFVAGRPVSPSFRTFYPGIEWNLRRPDTQSAEDRWFLTAWMKWQGTGPPGLDLGTQLTVHVEENSALFLIAPNLTQPIFLRSRVDARDRRQIARTLDPKPESAVSESGVILLDDLIERH